MGLCGSSCLSSSWLDVSQNEALLRLLQVCLSAYGHWPFVLIFFMELSLSIIPNSQSCLYMFICLYIYPFRKRDKTFPRFGKQAHRYLRFASYAYSSVVLFSVFEESSVLDHCIPPLILRFCLSLVIVLSTSTMSATKFLAIPQPSTYFPTTCGIQPMNRCLTSSALVSNSEHFKQLHVFPHSYLELYQGFFFTLI